MTGPFAMEQLSQLFIPMSRAVKQAGDGESGMTGPVAMEQLSQPRIPMSRAVKQAGDGSCPVGSKTSKRKFCAESFLFDSFSFSEEKECTTLGISLLFGIKKEKNGQQ
ncbi:MAG: hypothetical protein HFF39_04105 [Lawsonibacter sp.]|nr:hypothetical protein [Lawsonibacter sp.]